MPSYGDILLPSTAVNVFWSSTSVCRPHVIITFYTIDVNDILAILKTWYAVLMLLLCNKHFFTSCVYFLTCSKLTSILHDKIMVNIYPGIVEFIPKHRLTLYRNIIKNNKLICLEVCRWVRLHIWNFIVINAPCTLTNVYLATLLIE